MLNEVKCIFELKFAGVYIINKDKHIKNSYIVRSFTVIVEGMSPARGK